MNLIWAQVIASALKVVVPMAQALEKAIPESGNGPLKKEIVLDAVKTAAVQAAGDAIQSSEMPKVVADVLPKAEAVLSEFVAVMNLLSLWKKGPAVQTAQDTTAQ